jgi:hypothetical protein
MIAFSRLAGTSVLVTILTTQFANAEVTADDVWQNTRDVFATLGGDFSASKARYGDTLAISDVGIAFQFPFDAGNMSVTFPDIEMVENGDGTVSLSYPTAPVYGYAVEITGQTSFSGKIELIYDNLDYVASGFPGDVTYAYSVDNIAFESTELSVEGNQPIALEIKGTVSDVSSTNRVAVTSVVTIDSSLTSNAQKGVFNFGLHQKEFTGFELAVENQISTSKIVLPRGGMDIMNLAAASRAGLSIEGSSTFGAYENRQISKNNGVVVSDQITLVKNYLTEAEMNANHIKVDTNTAEMTLSISAIDMLPFPISIAMKSGKSAMLFPWSASSDLQKFEMSGSVTDMVLPQDALALIDPEHALPDDPVNFSLDISGQIKNMVNWLDFETVIAVIQGGEIPIEIHALTFNDLALNMFGASLSGLGAATFDNSDMGKPGGYPKPTGSLDLTMTGGNALLDTLVNIGLVQEDQAMGARMAIATIAKPDPDAGPDAMKSELEINEQGHISANGMRIK